MSLMNNLMVLTADTGFNISEVMTSAVSGVQSELLSVLVIVVPAAAVVTAAVVSVKFGMKWLKSLGK